MEQSEFNRMLVRAIEDRVIIITTTSDGYIIVTNQRGRIISV